MAIHTPNPNPNAFVRIMRKAYNPIGFKKGYNFTLFSIFAGALLGFCLGKIAAVDVNGYWKRTAPPGEYFYYGKKFYNIMLHLHLICIIPAGILVVFQFLPIIRYKVLMFHRVNGYAIILLLLVSNVGALGIARRAFGGSLATQVLVGVLPISTTTSTVLAYTNIKHLQIDQHRAWMLRCWLYAGSIITLRLIMVIMAAVIGQTGDYFTYYHVMRCEQIAFTGGQDIANTYPACQANPQGLAIVRATIGNAKSIVEAAAGLEVCFAAAAWLAFFIHAVGVEVYLRLTPAESERLRKASHERQLERGLHPAGSAGLTADRLGYAEQWRPPVVAEKATKSFETSQDGLAVPDFDDRSSSESSSDVSRQPPTLGWR